MSQEESNVQASVVEVASEQIIAPSEIKSGVQLEAVDLSALDPARNGTLETLQRIEQNTEALAKNIARETTANIRTLRRMQSRQPAGERQPLVPGATVAPAPEVGTRARVARARTRAPEREQPGTPEPAEVVATPERTRQQRRQRQQDGESASQPERPASRTATPEPAEVVATPERTRQQRRQRQQDGESASQPERPSQLQRGANGRFQSRAEQALEERQQEQQEQQRTRTLADVLREGLEAGGSVLDGGDAKDAVGAAVGGPVYAAAQELKGAYDELADEESWSGKLIRRGMAKVGKNGDRERLQDAEHHAEAMDASEASRAVIEEVRQAGEQSADAIEAQTELQRRQHQEQMDALERVSQSAANGGGGSTTILGGLKGALGGAAAKAGGFLKGAGGKALGGLGAALAGIFAYSTKSAELAQREDLTESQKTAQAAATGIGAGGGALAGAAGGAAAGAAIGSVIPGLGTLVGGVVGSIAGGIAGAWGGEKLGEAVGEAVSDTMDSVEEEAAKILEERDAKIERQASEVSSRGFKLFSPSTWFGGKDDKPVVSDRGRSSAPPSLRGTDAEILASTGLGRVSEKYESGGRGVATISTGIGDAGGVSYGKHQLASKTGTMQAFLNSKEGEAYRARFAGQEAGSAQFNETYKQVVAEDAEGFADAQHAFIKRTHFDPVAQYAKAKGIDVNDPAIQEALWSQSVQHGGKGNRKIIDDAVARAGEGADSEQVINALYDARTDYASQFASRAATTDRYMRERQDVLAIARQGSQQAESGEIEAKASPQQPSAEQPAQGAPEGQQGAIGNRVGEPAPEGQPSIAVAGQPSGAVSSMTPVASLVASPQAAAVAPAALAARADAVVPIQAPEPVRAPMQAQPQQHAFDPRTISAEIAKAVASAVTQAGSDDSKRTDQIKPGDANAAQEVAANIPMEFDDMLMMLVAHDRV